GFVGGSAEPIHPIFAMNFFGEDGAGFGPAPIPVALIRGENHPETLPMNEIGRSCQAKLCVFLVVAGVGEVVGLIDLYKPRVFHSAVFFVVLFGRENWVGLARKVNSVGTVRIAEAGRTVRILRSI